MSTILVITAVSSMKTRRGASSSDCSAFSSARAAATSGRSCSAARLALYELAMLVWDIVTKTHEVLAHTGFFSPHPASILQRWGAAPAQRDRPSPDHARRHRELGVSPGAGGRLDPFGNLDTNPDVIGTGHSVTDRNTPFYPVLRARLAPRGSGSTIIRDDAE